MGSYHKVSNTYLPMYLNEFQFRFNNRKNPDIFDLIVAGCSGRNAGSGFSRRQALHNCDFHFGGPHGQEENRCTGSRAFEAARRTFWKPRLILMRSLRKSFLLILIVLALLQSIVRSASALPPNASDRHKTAQAQVSGARDKHSATAQPCPAVTVVVQQIPPKEAQRITAVIQDEPYDHWWQGPRGPEWALFLLTIPYVIISAGLLYVSWRSANAAMVAARAAALAVGADRSFLEVEKPELKGTNLFVAHFHFKNRGNRPA